jgi:hypothetical protein
MTFPVRLIYALETEPLTMGSMAPKKGGSVTPAVQMQNGFWTLYFLALVITFAYLGDN